MLTGIRNSLTYKAMREIKNLFVDEARYFFMRLRNTAEAIRDLMLDEKLGIETGQYISKEDRSLHKDMSPSVPTPYPVLREIFEYLLPGPTDTFIDIGCGKGRAVFMAAEGNIKKAIGIELDGNIVAVARDNLRLLKTPAVNVEFVRGDAASADLRDGTVFFMYNPFGYKTLSRVTDNIKSSLTDNPRKIRIAYYSPVHREIFDNEDWLKIEKVLDDVDTVIWTNAA